MMRKKPVLQEWHRQKGVLSLVEVIIIIVILSILASASIISYRGAKDRALIKQACGMLNDVRQALSVYYTELDAYPKGMASFNDVYQALSAYGLEVDPSPDFSAFVSFSSYELTTGPYYVLVSRAKDSQKIALTATPDVIEAVHPNGEDFANACNR